MSFWERVRGAFGRSRARKDRAALDRRAIAEDERVRKAAQGDALPPHYEEISQPRSIIPPPPTSGP